MHRSRRRTERRQAGLNGGVHMGLSSALAGRINLGCLAPVTVAALGRALPRRRRGDPPGVPVPGPAVAVARRIRARPGLPVPAAIASQLDTAAGASVRLLVLDRVITAPAARVGEPQPDSHGHRALRTDVMGLRTDARSLLTQDPHSPSGPRIMVSRPAKRNASADTAKIQRESRRRLVPPRAKPSAYSCQ